MIKIGHLDIDLTRKCNLNCPYCYLGKLKCRETMDDEVLAACLELVAKLGTVTDTRRASTVNFYGGEPLLAFDKIRWFVEAAAARGYKLRYCVVSNGVIAAPEIVTFCRRHKMTVQRSLDGCPQAMELCRGRGTLERYNKATEVWQDLGRTRRTTVIPETAQHPVASVQYMHELGFRKGTSPQPDYYSQWKPEQLKAFRDNLWLLAQDYVKDFREGRGGFYTWWFEQEFRRFDWQRGRPETLGCGAGRTLFCVAWDGYVFPCHRFSTEERDSEFCGGHIQDYLAGKERGFGPAVLQKLQQAWDKQRPAQCTECVGQYGCQGNCYHANLKTTGDMLVPSPVYCEFNREAALCVQWIDNQLRAIDPQWWKRRGPRRAAPVAPAQSNRSAAVATQTSGG